MAEACEDWQCAVMALKLMANVQVKADSISFNAVMAACDAWQQAPPPSSQERSSQVS